MNRNPLAKRNRLIRRRLIFITLIAAACSFAIALFWSANQPTQQTMGRMDVNPQPSVTLSSPNEITLNPGDKQTGESDIFTTQPNRKRVTIAKAHQLFPDSPRVNSTGEAEEQALFPANSQPNITVQPQNLNLEIPEDTVTASVETVQEPQIEAVSQGIPEWELQSDSFPVPAEFRAKIVNNIIPSGEQKAIALTFDDGPSPHNTLQVLEILKQNNVKATFFLIGRNLKAYPKIAKQVVADGHAIGNHTWHHWYHQMDQSTAAHEIDDTAELFYKTMGITTSLFRPPGGVIDNGVVDYAKTKNYVTVMWSVDPMDYRQLPAQDLVKNVIEKAQPGAIVLMHDGGGKQSATLEALPQIIAKLQELGYRFVTVPELLDQRTPQQSGGL